MKSGCTNYAADCIHSRKCCRNEDLMQVSHNLEISLPGVISSQAEQDDTQLVQASQQGDQDAFAFLVQRHQRRIFNLICACARL